MIHCLNPECNHINSDRETNCQQCNRSLLIDNRYGAIKVIGKGGFGKTFLGKDYHSKNLSPCVIKQLLPSPQNQNQKNWQLFQEEATRLQSLNSYPQIPKLFGFFIQEKKYYIIQEFIDGETLALELKKTGYFTEEKIIKLLDELLPILKSIHKNNIIHRDIKPENIIRKSDNQKLYLVDFGASKLLEKEDRSKTGTVIGSPEYVAPEQARGKAVLASDIYSLGVTCIHLLTNRSAFDLIDLNNNWIWQQYINQKISFDLKEILDKMIDFSLNKRYQNVDQVINDLHNLGRRKIKLSLPIVSSLGLLGISGILSLILSQKPTKVLEKQALEGLILLTNIQDQYYQKNGEFLDKNFYLPFAQGHVFTLKKITDHRLAIIALAKQKNLKNFVTMIWGGQQDLPANLAKIESYKPKNDDWGVLQSPNMSREKPISPQYTIRFNHCETEKPEQKFPNFESLNTEDSLPLSYDELACPVGYVYSISMMEVMGEYSAKVLPAIIYELDGDNLRINQ